MIESIGGKPGEERHTFGIYRVRKSDSMYTVEFYKVIWDSVESGALSTIPPTSRRDLSNPMDYGIEKYISSARGDITKFLASEQIPYSAYSSIYVACDDYRRFSRGDPVCKRETIATDQFPNTDETKQNVILDICVATSTLSEGAQMFIHHSPTVTGVKSLYDTLVTLIGQRSSTQNNRLEKLISVLKSRLELARDNVHKYIPAFPSVIELLGQVLHQVSSDTTGSIKSQVLFVECVGVLDIMRQMKDGIKDRSEMPIDKFYLLVRKLFTEYQSVYVSDLARASD